MHRIDAKVTGTDPANDGVEVRTVAIEVSASRMDQVGDLLDVGLEEAARIRIGQHDASDIIRLFKLRFQLVQFHAAARIGLDLVHDEAALNRGCRIRSVGGGGHQNALAGLGLAARDQRLTDCHHAAELAMRPGFGAHRNRRHAG